jgi:hypothetical protein
MSGMPDLLLWLPGALLPPLDTFLPLKILNAAHLSTPLSVFLVVLQTFLCVMPCGTHPHIDMQILKIMQGASVVLRGS